MAEAFEVEVLKQLTVIIERTTGLENQFKAMNGTLAGIKLWRASHETIHSLDDIEVIEKKAYRKGKHDGVVGPINAVIVTLNKLDNAFIWFLLGGALFVTGGIFVNGILGILK